MAKKHLTQLRFYLSFYAPKRLSVFLYLVFGGRCCCCRCDSSRSRLSFRMLVVVVGGGVVMVPRIWHKDRDCQGSMATMCRFVYNGLQCE